MVYDRMVGCNIIKKGGIHISTKEKIREEALSLFAKKGYYGTSITDITDCVGISKSSLYSHYSSKDEIFLAVFEDVAEKHGRLFEHLLEASKEMGIQNKLYYHFKEYILYFYRNPQVHYFSSMSLFHVPPELGEIIRLKYLNWEKPYRKSLEEIFREGMQKRVICTGSPDKKVWSFKIKRDGVAAWLRASPDLNEKCIEEFWHDFWFGVTKSN